MFCLSLLNDKILEGLHHVFFIHCLPYSISKQCLSRLCPHPFIFVDLMLSTLPLTKKCIHYYSEIFLSSDSSFSSLTKLRWEIRELRELASPPLVVREVWKSVSWVNWGSPRCLLFHITSSPRKTSLGSTFLSNHISLLLLLLSCFSHVRLLCDPRDGSPPGSPVPGILQARTLEWVAIAFSPTSL